MHAHSRTLFSASKIRVRSPIDMMLLELASFSSIDALRAG